jgi:hypothetical protein
MENPMLWYSLTGAGVGFVVWLVRLEGKVKTREQISKIETEKFEKLSESFKELDKKIDEIQVTLAGQTALLQGRGKRSTDK